MLSDHEKRQCHDAAIKAKHRSEMQNTNPFSVPLIVGIRHIEEELFKKIGTYVFDI